MFILALGCSSKNCKNKKFKIENKMISLKKSKLQKRNANSMWK